jgi:hypothetical protein
VRVDDVNVGGRIASAPTPAPGVLDGVEASVTCCDGLSSGFGTVEDFSCVKGGVSNQLFWIFTCWMARGLVPCSKQWVA